MIPTELQPFVNHLWQSTLFAAVAGLLTLTLRKNRAQTRYWLWFAASLKFLIPFSFLVYAGSYFGPQTPMITVRSSLSAVIDQISGPFGTTVTPVTMPTAQPSRAIVIPAILAAVWAVGFVWLVGSGCLRWWRVRTSLRTATPLQLPIDIPVMCSPAFSEPVVVGICKPALLLPAGITDHLTPPQFEAILSHELCHVRRRDNLTAAVHMTVEAVFWFHPLVWWLGARLMDERERACDEEVLRMGSEPQDYAEGILKICELYLESPVQCISGITGANLVKRIEAIIANRIPLKLHFAKRLALSISGVAALALPIAFGVINAPFIRAQSSQAARRPQLPSVPLEFEVASVKRNHNPPLGTRAINLDVLASHGRLTLEALSLRHLILVAYEVQSDQVQGCPRWCDSDLFDVAAKAEDQNVTTAQVERMLQKLLADRFKLVLHRETRERPGLVLTVAKNGPKLKLAGDDETESATRTGNIRTFQKMSIQGLVNFLAINAKQPVVDKTGLKGLYNFTIDLTPNDPLPAAGRGQPTAADPGNTLFYRLSVAVEDQLGLKLESQRVSVENLVIDSVEHPSEN